MIDQPKVGEVVSLGMGPDIFRSLRRIHDVLVYETFVEICIKSERATGPNYKNYTAEAFHRVVWTFAGLRRITWRSHNPERDEDA